MQIEDFEFIKPISKGAFGSVYIGKKTNSDKRYAIKVLDKSYAQLKNMIEEISSEKNIMAQIDFEYIVRLYYCLQSTNKIYFVLEFCIGGDLCSMLCAVGYFEEETALYYLAQVIFAVSYLHKKNIIHRDIKPENMLINENGMLKLSDFGLSAMWNAEFTYQQVSACMTPNQSKSIQEELVYDRLLPNTETPSILQPKFDRSEKPPPKLSIDDTLEESFNNIRIDHSVKLSQYSSFDDVMFESPSNKRSREIVQERKPQKPEDRGGTVNHDDEEETEVLRSAPMAFAHKPIRNSLCSSDNEIIWSESRKSNLRRTSIQNTPPKTPRRTPRHTKRRRSIQTRESLVNAKVIGSPDYMPPELLEKQAICRLSDVWSIGVCYFEFLVGIPPFNDNSAGQVFENIKTLKIDWPAPEDHEGLSDDSVNLITKLLSKHPYSRPQVENIIIMEPFSRIMEPSSFSKMMEEFQTIPAPFIPEISSHDDVTFFEAKNIAKKILF